MAKDDYFVIVCKALLYFYGCLKREVCFSNVYFVDMVKKDIEEQYFLDVLRMMSDEGYIEGYRYAKDFGRDVIMLSKYEAIRITQKGIEYLQENYMMKKAKKLLVENRDKIVDLIFAMKANVF